MKIKELTVNQMQNPMGVDERSIEFSWKILSEKSMLQKRYDLQVALDHEFNEVIWHQNEWNDQSTNILYRGPKLCSKTVYFVRVKASDFDDVETDWCSTTFETGILNEQEWQAEWITTTERQIADEGIRKPFTGKTNFAVANEIKSARLYISALGIYSATLNGEKIGQDYFTPGWTDYNDRVQYQIYDITEMLGKENEIAVTVAEGWFSGYLGWEKKKDTYGNFNAFIAQIELESTDGTRTIIGSDATWVEESNPWLSADLYNGEIQDKNASTKDLANMKTLSISKGFLVSQENEPVRKQEELQPIDLFTDTSGRLILDLGQNMVGWVKCQVKGEKGQAVSLTHGEILDKDGNFYRGNIRDAQQKDTFILSGELDVLEPNFTFHGFRYVHLENFPADIKKEDFVGVVLHSDMPITGQFETSDPALNQLHHNVLWGQKGNFLDVPTDCPQRDERLGWTADAQIFFPTASFNMNTVNFFKKWLRDLTFAQLDNGAVPFVVPDVLKGVFADNAAKTTAAWGDAATIIPWEMYQRFGNQVILNEAYPSMKKWVDYIRGQGREEALWDTGLQLGDWLALDSEEGSFFGATDETLIASCYFAHSAQIVAKAAKVLGNFQDYKEYQALYEEIKKKIAARYFDNEGRLFSDTQTAHIIVLVFGLCPKAYEKQIVARLVELIESKGKHLDTGFVGSPYICQVLADHGHLDLAYHLLFNKDLPSWLYQIEKGATTVWEHWDGIKSDGTFWDDGMNSFNHYSYGSIGIWMYETIGGLRCKAPGYKQSIVAPKPSAKLTSCQTSLETPFGQLACEWSVTEGQMTMTVKVPANTEAEIILPNVADKDAVLSQIKEQWQPKRIGALAGDDVTDIGIANFKEHQAETQQAVLGENELMLFVGSGNYQISYQIVK